ncbi:MAG: serine/threonine-protein kinase, partial [Actinomycetota bacterium]
MSDEVPGRSGGVLGGMPGFVPGSQVAGYRLEEPIGQGGMAAVFRARDERLGRVVALKILAPALAADDAFRQRFIRESRAAAAVDDPHIIPVFEAGDANGVLFIAMRYVGGGDVRTLVQSVGPLPVGRAAAIISPVASALDAAHAAGLVHRDVKPANMLLDTRPGRPEHVYLSDFGLSKGAASTSGLTRVGQFLGTLDYISPEQIEGKLTDGRADEYALACTVFEMLTGLPPFHRAEATAVMYAQISQPPPPLTAMRPDLPAAADAVMARALAKAPADRYATCCEFSDALRAAFGLQPYDSGPGTIPVPGRGATELAQRGAQPPAAGDGQIAAAAAVTAAPMSAPPVSAPPVSAPPVSAPPVPAVGAAQQSADDATRTAQPAPAGWTVPAPGGAPPPPSPPRRTRRRGVILAAAIGVAVVAAAVIVPVVLAQSSGHSGAQHRPAPVGSIPMTLSARYKPIDGYVSVLYQDGKFGTASVHGQVTGAVSGEVARLYAQQFPFDGAPAQVSSAILESSGRAASYTFPVTPSVATRYQVKLFHNSTAKSPRAISAVSTLYVITGGTRHGITKCARPVCRETLHYRLHVPPSAMDTELAKRPIPYFGLHLSPTKAPARVRTLDLDGGDPLVPPIRKISANVLEVRFTFTFQVGNNGYSWDGDACVQDTEPEDG